MTLKKSRFTVAVPYANAPDDYIIVYQTMTAAFVLIGSEDWSIVCQAPDRSDPETRRFLRQQGFFLPRGTDETVVYQCWKDQHMHDFSTITSKVLVTRRCNLRCRYCVLDAGGRDMTQETAARMDAFYLSYIEEKRPRSVRDDFLGGEPLLNSDIIEECAGRRLAHCKAHGIAYAFTITTNGTLLAPERVSKLKTVGLSSINVSMAGPKTVHDRLRPSADGGKTYGRILANLAAISGMVPVTIECQYDSGAADYQRMPEMLTDFKNRGIEIEAVHFTPILPRQGENAFHCGVGDPGISLELMAMARQHGLAEPLEAPSSLCLAERRARFVFDIDGSLIACPALNEGEQAYGNVDSGIDFVNEAQLLYRQLPEKCMEDCPLLPMCRGGCRHQAMVFQGDFNGIDCRYDAMYRHLEAYLQQRAAQVMDSGHSA